MGKTKIGWTDYTFNPWWGCTKVSPGCDHCYAEAFDHRVGGDHWGPMQPRRTMSEAYWKGPRLWNRAAEATGRRARVFCASMADVFDVEAPKGERERLWIEISCTPYLDWLLLTKRPQVAKRMLPKDWGQGWPNVWLGTSVENQTEADRRIPHLLNTPAAVRFLSCEPLLGPIDFYDSAVAPLQHFPDEPNGQTGRIDWVIVGGESGPKHRQMDVAWLTGIVGQAKDASLPVFVKQDSGPYPETQGRIPSDVWALKEWPK